MTTSMSYFAAVASTVEPALMHEIMDCISIANEMGESIRVMLAEHFYGNQYATAVCDALLDAAAADRTI